MMRNWLLLAMMATSFCADSQELDHYQVLSNVYDNILQGYNINLRPGQGLKALPVGVTIYVLRVAKVDDEEQEFHWDMYFRQFWNDERLSFTNKGAPDSLESLQSAALKKRVWTPDPFFLNQREGHVLDNPSDNTFFRISRNGDILHSSRQLVRTACPMDFTKYPFDTQECTLEVESFAHTTNDIRYYWRNGNDSVTVSEGLTIPNFKLSNVYLDTKRIKTATGEFERLTLTFVITRNSRKFITRSAMPTAVVIIVSWLPFWLDPVTNAGSRFILVGLSNFALLLLTYMATSRLKISYVTQAHVFFFDCFFFLLINLLQTILICTIARNAKRLEEDGRCNSRCQNRFIWLDILFRVAYLPIFFIFYAAFLSG